MSRQSGSRKMGFRGVAASGTLVAVALAGGSAEAQPDPHDSTGVTAEQLSGEWLRSYNNMGLVVQELGDACMKAEASTLPDSHHSKSQDVYSFRSFYASGKFTGECMTVMNGRTVTAVGATSMDGTRYDVYRVGDGPWQMQVTTEWAGDTDGDHKLYNSALLEHDGSTKVWETGNPWEERNTKPTDMPLTVVADINQILNYRLSTQP